MSCPTARTPYAHGDDVRCPRCVAPYVPKLDRPTQTTELGGREWMFSEGQLVATQHDRPDGDGIDVCELFNGAGEFGDYSAELACQIEDLWQLDATDADEVAAWALVAMSEECKP